jgi:hypothetical protein
VVFCMAADESLKVGSKLLDFLPKVYNAKIKIP